MVIRVLLSGVLILALGAEETAARQWVSRDGRFSVEADLLSVDDGQVVLRRESGAVLRVPMERLSLGDVKYVQEAMQAAGMALPSQEAEAKEVPPSTEAGSPQSAPSTSRSSSGGAADPVPPLADPGLARWQAVPDPSNQGFDLKPGKSVEISLATRHSRPFVLFPSAPSPFVVLGSGENRALHQLWDLREERVVGEIDVEIGSGNKAALSHDGRYLAFNDYRTRGQVPVWSFETGKVAQSLELPHDHSLVGFIGFAKPNRIIIGENRESTYLVYDVDSGQQCGTIQAEPTSRTESHMLSPGGNYLVIHPSGTKPMAIYDTRNGVCAGFLRTEVGTYVTPVCMGFSRDGKEFFACFREGGGYIIQVWDMTDGSTSSTLRLAEDPGRQLGFISYQGPLLEWLADRSGWLFSGVAMLDRETGQIIWQDREAISASSILPRRIVDTDRMLTIRKGEKEVTLRLLSIPKEEIANSRKIVASGGMASDAGLPSTTPVNIKDATEISWDSAAWTYRAAVSALPAEAALRNHLRLGDGGFDFRRVCFSRPDAARLAIGEILPSPEAKWKAVGTYPQACRLYDLQSGEQVARFEVPFPSEFLDVSPDGKLGLFRIDRTKDRLDVWNLEDGEHIVAFRPFDEESLTGRQVGSAHFIDEKHVVTVAGNGRLIAWELPACRAMYTAKPTYRRVAGMTRDRRVMTVVAGTTPHLVDTMTGKVIGTLPPVESDDTIVAPQASFSADENRLAVLFTHDDGCLLAVWNLADHTMTTRLNLPFNTYGLVWCGPNHVLLNRSSGSDDPDTVVDVERGLVVWNYETQLGTSLPCSPDSRCWLGCRSADELLALELPDQEVKALLTRVRAPEPLIGPNATVTVQTQIENPPQMVPPGWANLERLDEGLYQHFSQRLKDGRVDVVARGNVRLVVGIDRKKVEETMTVGRLFGPPKQLLLSATLLTPYVAVLDSNGNRIWSKQPKKGQLKSPDLDDCPEGMDKETYLRLQQWEDAVTWLRSVEIPYPLFHPSVNRGFGDSIVTPDGPQIRRSPSPTQLKPQNKTASNSPRTSKLSG